MTTWKDGGDSGRLCRAITDKAGGQDICRVWTKKDVISDDISRWDIKPWPEGEANFRLILQAPQMLEALEATYEKVERMMQDTSVPVTWLAVLAVVRRDARAAIAAVKGEE